MHILTALFAVLGPVLSVAFLWIGFKRDKAANSTDRLYRQLFRVYGWVCALITALVFMPSYERPGPVILVAALVFLCELLYTLYPKP